MKALTTYGSEQLTEEQAHDLVSQLEPDHNGVVNYVEYINMVRAVVERVLCSGGQWPLAVPAPAYPFSLRVL